MGVGHVCQQHVGEEGESDEVFIDECDLGLDTTDERPTHKKIGLNEDLDEEKSNYLERWVIS